MTREYCDCGAELDGLGYCPECDYEPIEDDDGDRCAHCGGRTIGEVCCICHRPLCVACAEQCGHVCHGDHSDCEGVEVVCELGGGR